MPTQFYVSTTGDDAGDGSALSPYRTINRAAQEVKPGDTVIVKAGIYRETVWIDHGGSADAQVTIKSEVPGGAQLRPPADGWNGISVNANYVTIEGFDIKGARGDGIEANDVHHIKVLNNTLSTCGESGIQFNWSEFITVEGNTTANNATSGWFSGISIYQSRNITGDTTTEGYRTIVRDNISYGNVTQGGLHTDGNGIIIDDFQSTQDNDFGNYTYPTLVENNLVYQNGGKGIQVTWSDNVTVRNNTAWHNNQDPLNTGTWRGELSNSESSNNTWVNNIGVADPTINSDNTAIANTSGEDYQNTNVIWANNLTFDGTAGEASIRADGGNTIPSAADGNLLGVDPRFADLPADFYLLAGSPAINGGTGVYGLPPQDLAGGPRAVGTVDIGAYVVGLQPGTPPRAIAATGDDGSNDLAGGAGNDTLMAGAGDDVLRLDGGDDVMRGGLGNDTVVYTGTGAIRLDLTQKGAQVTGLGTDTLTQIENIRSGLGHDRLTGTNGANLLAASDGNDTMVGGGGNDTLFGGWGDDWMTGGAGDDHIDGGQSVDTAVYLGAAAIRIDLSVTTGQATGQGFDTLINIENLRSGRGHDALTGNRSANILISGAGDDTLVGGGGDDELIGGIGDDILIGGIGDDILIGGGDADILTGGGGADEFVFDRPFGLGNIDRITDFAIDDDLIVLNLGIFTESDGYRLENEAFAANLSGRADSEFTRIIYEIDTGKLRYDSDGTGSDKAVVFATLQSGLDMHSDNFGFI